MPPAAPSSATVPVKAIDWDALDAGKYEDEAAAVLGPELADATVEWL